ncbi:hypothetical protein LTR16_006302, partial [Cryomyces antarcticus]
MDIGYSWQGDIEGRAGDSDSLMFAAFIVVYECLEGVYRVLVCFRESVRVVVELPYLLVLPDALKAWICRFSNVACAIADMLSGGLGPGVVTSLAVSMSHEPAS